MVVALGAVSGQAHVNPAHGLNTIRGIESKVFFINGAAFVSRDIAALEASSDEL